MFFCWYHKGFSNSSQTRLTHDGVHLDPLGQYYLYGVAMAAPF